MTVTLERQMHAQVVEWHGDTPDVRRWERIRTVLTNITDTAGLAAWFFVLGVPLFVALFLPIQLAGWLIVSHFNWVSHGGDDPEHDYHPRNLDHGWYWLANRLWFGLYFHANHHRWPYLFDPRKRSASEP